RNLAGVAARRRGDGVFDLLPGVCDREPATAGGVGRVFGDREVSDGEAWAVPECAATPAVRVGTRSGDCRGSGPAVRAIADDARHTVAGLCEAGCVSQSDTHPASQRPATEKPTCWRVPCPRLCVGMGAPPCPRKAV